MKPEPRCDLTELLVADCAHCRGLKSPDEQAASERRRLIVSGRWIAAQYPGECSCCGERFEVDAAIRKDTIGWRADCCGEEATS